ncbi:type VI secretion system contractile sheath domain-containing protein [Actibacterium ureilyticum]|uniref:type VI secretion system contractile sheath domain-containing protein n=1 Tax=Actibacterium ureilyticum TaxID=1590614 RepID=UPI000BAABFD1|nr:type VI secretion system contractile sheath large subunit [Actibacterium ureilyticum]
MSGSRSPFGQIPAGAPVIGPAERGRFRIAVFGDFSGRAVSGRTEGSDAIATRRAAPLDVDTLDAVIESFATTLVLPIGRDGDGVAVPLNAFDDLHPDALYANVEMFQSLSTLRQRLATGSLADGALQDLRDWGARFDRPVTVPKRSAGTAVRADIRISDFQALIGGGRQRHASAADDLIAQVVGPYVLQRPDTGVDAMRATVDEALGGAMRLVLHHPDFQALESHWRSLDFLARNIETDAAVELVVFDLSASELAADLAAGDDLSQSGLFRLLMRACGTTGGFSAMFGLYEFEDTPPHAELLGRLSRIAEHAGAPFITALANRSIDVALKDRHPLAKRSWDQLARLPSARYLGLAAPRFMLRQPYGRNSDPITAFRFDEFSRREGLRGFLWANPALLVAVLMARSFAEDGQAMRLGRVMTLGDIPFYWVNDRYGDQVALPCTERNLAVRGLEAVAKRHIMPVLWMKGRDQIRLGAFQSVAGAPLAGPWSPGAAWEAQKKTPAPARTPQVEVLMPVVTPLDTPDDASEPAPEPQQPDAEAPALTPEEEDVLDTLLASFEDEDETDTGSDGDIDPELAALLEGL